MSIMVKPWQCPHCHVLGFPYKLKSIFPYGRIWRREIIAECCDKVVVITYYGLYANHRLADQAEGK